jgi:hypothetical protein
MTKSDSEAEAEDGRVRKEGFQRDRDRIVSYLFLTSPSHR